MKPSVLLFAASEHQGDRLRQEDYFSNYRDECFVIADGVGGIPHGDTASRLAGDTAIWGYRHVRQRRFYWQDKKLFVNRIFRSANLALWQKQRETGFGDGCASTLTVCMIGARTYWVGSIGDSPAFLYHNNELTKLTSDDLDHDGYLTEALGTKRYGLVPHFMTGEFLFGETIVLTTDGISGYVSLQEIMTIAESITDTQEDIISGVKMLIRKARENGSGDNMSACIIRRVKP